MPSRVDKTTHNDNDNNNDFIHTTIYIDTSFISNDSMIFKGLHCMEFLSIWTKVLALGKLFTWQPYQDTLRQWLETRVDSSHNGFTLGRFRETLLLSSFGLVAVLNMPYIYIHIHMHIYTYIHIHIYTYFKGNPPQLVKAFSTIENLLQHGTPWNQSFWKPGRWAKTTKITTSNNCYLHCSSNPVIQAAQLLLNYGCPPHVRIAGVTALDLAIAACQVAMDKRRVGRSTMWQEECEIIQTIWGLD